MTPLFEELDYQTTPIGDVSLRRRTEPRVADTLVYEVKLGDEFLMSSLFTAGETALADLGLAWLEQSNLNVVVGGLGLGYTAAAALRDPRVSELLVVEYLSVVIDWHRRSLVPLGESLTNDPRCRFVNGDFFALAAEQGEGFDTRQPARRFDAILLDVDHSPEHLLSSANAGFYSVAGLSTMQRLMIPGGVFAMWSNDPPDPPFIGHLGKAFSEVDAQVVDFPNPYSGGTATCTIYRARCA
ncbi:MAG: spermidine synthase [Gammaproteobacteria bacterium]|jgi:spermidine synthase